jgi:hypothetical protein
MAVFFPLQIDRVAACLTQLLKFVKIMKLPRSITCRLLTKTGPFSIKKPPGKPGG